MKIILASQSPRRKEILTAMGVSFETIPSMYEEKLDESRDAQEVAKELALGKAMWVARQHPDALVIGSDTVVGINGRQLEKPKDMDDARELLTSLSSGVSFVTTGVAVVSLAAGIELVEEATTYVHFKPDSPEVSQQREAYLQSGDWHDKAGGFGLQSGAAPLIEKIIGDYDTVVGLPSRRLTEMLARAGVQAHAVTEPSPVPQEQHPDSLL